MSDITIQKNLKSETPSKPVKVMKKEKRVFGDEQEIIKAKDTLKSIKIKESFWERLLKIFMNKTEPIRAEIITAIHDSQDDKQKTDPQRRQGNVTIRVYIMSLVSQKIVGLITSYLKFAAFMELLKTIFPIIDTWTVGL